ncbi:MAG TPA: LLM class F420-dependent oxidoreductase [Candidatus Binatia bacterium]|jgi:F420-dependent oxidoreductase-like protein|nr:LLM class F420-dependent oxidoreductase [Candidatus Binatia bacterium]
MATHPIRFGIQTGQQNLEWAQMLDLWRQADLWGYDSLWNFDHFYAIFLPPELPCLEGWTTLSALALATKRARVGTMVTGNTYRHPCVTAKMAATVDHISGGRLNLGIGAGWFELEHRSFGIDFKTVPQRLQALDEACRIIRGMLTQEHTTVQGRHYTVTEAMGNPKPIQQPHPPIMIGGTGERVLLRLVARHADMWNASASAERMRALIEVIRRHGDTERRDPERIEKTVMMPLCYRAPAERQAFMCSTIAGLRQTTPEQARKEMMIGDKLECLDVVDRYVKAGVTHFIFMLFAPFFVDEIQAFAEEVIPAVRGADARVETA